MTWSEAVRWTHPHHPRTPPPGPGFGERLLETAFWTDRAGVAHPLTEMSDDYLWAVLGYLRWYAPQIRALLDDADRTEQLPLALWLTSQPIWGAVACELVRRTELGHPADAMQRLLDAGPVPWETADAGS